MTCIVQHIQSLSSNARAAILIRHSERNKIPRGEFGTHYMLTENGVRMAEEFGTKLSEYGIVKIYTTMKMEQILILIITMTMEMVII